MAWRSHAHGCLQSTNEEAPRHAASREAIAGAALGSGAFAAPLGAACGESPARRDHGQALKVGVATRLGILARMLSTVVIAFTMVGLFMAALLI